MSKSLYSDSDSVKVFTTNCYVILWLKSDNKLKMMINLVLAKSELICLVKFGADFRMSFKLILAGLTRISQYEYILIHL